MSLNLATKVSLFLLILLFVIVLFWTISYIVYSIKRKRSKSNKPSHVQLYFDENFRNIIDEWDLMPRSQIKTWKKDMNKKLKVINRDINKIKKRKVSINSRLNSLEKNMTKLEEF